VIVKFGRTEKIPEELISPDVEETKQRFEEHYCWKDWRRGGAETWFRKSSDGEDLIERSEDLRQFLNKGTRIERAGGILPETYIVVDTDHNPSEKVSGTDYFLIQEEVPLMFHEKYPEVNYSALEDFGVNIAVIDALGFRPNSDSVIEDMLTDGKRCYMTDFGFDLGGSRYEPSNYVRDSALDFLHQKDRDSFREVYEIVYNRVKRETII
jgi:hypothetical protein